MKHKRKIAIILLLITLFCTLFSGCGDLDQNQGQSQGQGHGGQRETLDGFSVHYLDVGNGDCIFIKLQDGKTILIDCAEPDDKKAQNVIDYVKGYGVNKIDYFIITHPDADHIGNAVKIINEFTISRIYLPKLNEWALEYFPTLQQVNQLAKDKNIEIKRNDNFKSIIGDGYSLIFLTPYPSGLADSSYNDLNGALVPDQENVNNISPIIYLESNGLRFVFTGDAGSSQEKLALKVLNDPVFKAIIKNLGVSVNLTGVDFLKLGHHGSNSSSCKEFLQALAPKHAVVSVGGDNYYGHPTTEVLDRLNQANPDYKLFRTDVHGTISVGVADGQLKIITDKI